MLGNWVYGPLLRFKMEVNPISHGGSGRNVPPNQRNYLFVCFSPEPTPFPGIGELCFNHFYLNSMDLRGPLKFTVRFFNILYAVNYSYWNHTRAMGPSLLGLHWPPMEQKMDPVSRDSGWKRAFMVQILQISRQKTNLVWGESDISFQRYKWACPMIL